MKTFKSLFLSIAVAGTIYLLYGLGSTDSLHGQQVNAPGGAGSPGLPDVPATDSISGMFREVAKNALPAVVSIQTFGNVSPMTQSQFQSPFGLDPFGDDSLRSNPFFRDFFDRLPD